MLRISEKGIIFFKICLVEPFCYYRSQSLNNSTCIANNSWWTVIWKCTRLKIALNTCVPIMYMYFHIIFKEKVLSSLKFYSQYQQLETLGEPLCPHRGPRPVLLGEGPQYQLNRQALVGLIQGQVQWQMEALRLMLMMTLTC